ncbi:MULTISPECIES: DUF2000 domain-containing protein [Streptomyces]|uniref:DUF2000 domain-containing protein n=1 Tax=Streptomyces qinglanensis TaxID=943816 RepID=A0A1E7K1X8_9ACTN|nr:MULTISPECIES: DUF2000 domain-containing protein [Streptomyces]OEU97922.1 hypothetical protein AN217_08760 [Streptomyces qinglanensis]OEV11702.1 hypothetical protein AN220_30380 [Streptomyces nanshensis]
MRFDTKAAVLVRPDLAEWQQLNVTAFLASGLAGASDEVIGEPYEDGSGNRYLPLLREPVLCFAADRDGLAGAHRRALSRGLAIAVYTDEMFATGNDADNRAAVRAVEAEKLSLAGLALHGPRNSVDRAVKGLKLHR